MEMSATVRVKPAIMRPAVIIVLLAVAVVAIGAASHLIVHGGDPPIARPVRTANLVMQDRADGSIAVLRASDLHVIDVVPPDTNGFLRVVLAGLVRERRREGMGARSRPFHLTRWSDGRLTLDDVATRRLIELEAFGPTNEGAFEHLLDLSGPPPAK
jgi:putative photosynthetic complex assembly protein